MKAENERMKVDLTPNISTPEGKKIQILQEEKQKLKKEIDDIWLTLERKEAEVQKKNLEIKRLEETIKGLEKYKNEKSNLSKQVRELQSKLNQANITIQELKDEKVN